jgi:hypothetical protein
MKGLKNIHMYRAVLCFDREKFDFRSWKAHDPLSGFSLYECDSETLLAYHKNKDLTDTERCGQTLNLATFRSAYERRIERLEQENKELARKLADTTKTLQDLVNYLFHFRYYTYVQGSVLEPEP